MKTSKTTELVQTALFSAIIIIMAYVPYMGYIPLGFMNATIIHIPVILGALFLGPRKGVFLGFLFGLTSLLKNTFSPNLTSFVFSPFYTAGGVSGGVKSLIICFVPRILIGVVSYYIFAAVIRLGKGHKASKSLAFIAAGLAGAITNTLLVMHGIYFLFGSSYAAAKEVAENALYGLILSVIGMQGVPEAIVAAIIVLGVGQVLCHVTPLYTIAKKNLS